MKNCIVLPLLLLALAGPAPGQMVVATIEVGNGPSALVYDSVHNKVFAALEGPNQVAVIDPEANELVATVPAGFNPRALAWSPTSGKLYVGNDVLNENGTVTVINTADNTVITTLNVAREPVAMAWNSTRNKLYVANRGSSSVSVIDCATDRVIATIPLSQNLSAIIYNPVNDRIYVSSGAFQRPGVVHIINCASDQAVGSFNSGADAGAIAVNPVNNRLYVANTGSSNMSVTNCVNHSNLATLRTGNTPQAVLWAPNNRVYATAYWGGRLHIMNGDSLRFFREVGITGNPEAMLYNPRTEKLFIVKPLQSEVAVVDARPGHEGRLIDEITVGSGPKAMVLYPARDHIYVANAWGRNITVLRDVVGVAERPDRPVPARPGLELVPNPARPGARLYFRPGGPGPEQVEFLDAAGRRVGFADRDQPRAPEQPGVYFYRRSGTDRAHGRLVVR